MVTEPKKNISWLDGMVDNYTEIIESVKNEIAGIDEYYRKQCEDAKKTLNSYLEEAERQKAFWVEARDNGLNIQTASPKKTRTRKTKVEDKAEVKSTVSEDKVVEPEAASSEQEKVVDTIYPENNEPEEEPAAEAPAEPVKESSTDDDEWPFEEESPAAEESEPTEEEKADEWDAPEESSDESENVESKGIDPDEDWPDFPEDWK